MRMCCPILAYKRFNLVIEKLLISTITAHLPHRNTLELFQSRNRETFDFNRMGDRGRVGFYQRFNLVIEKLLISTYFNDFGIDHNYSFNLVIEKLLISTELPDTHRRLINVRFNLVIEKLLISTRDKVAEGVTIPSFNLVIEKLLISTLV